jgi:translation elongation factor EF-4
MFGDISENAITLKSTKKGKNVWVYWNVEIPQEAFMAVWNWMKIQVLEKDP